MKSYKVVFLLAILCIGGSIVSCSSDEGNEPKDKCEKAQYNPQTQFCFEGNVSDKGEFTDARDGRKYRYVEIGTQTWMAENLNFSNGDAIGRCYDYSEANCNKYGRLYYWYTVADVCPSGWSMPSNEDWQTLTNFLGEETAGKKLKARNSGGTDDYGFSALLGGEGSVPFTNQEYISYATIIATRGYNIDFSFHFIDEDEVWWGSEFDFRDSHYFQVDSLRDIVYKGKSGKFNLHYVRCIKSSSPSLYGTLTDDRDGETYRTINTGTKTWMVDNLKHNVTGSYCYDNLESNCESHGRLYERAAANMACPSGWHLPNDEELEEMIELVDAGRPSDYGFSANGLGGYGGPNGFQNFGFNLGYYWAYGGNGNHYQFTMHYLENGSGYASGALFSVRCVKTNDN